jgi:hypothetical protein
MQQISDGGSCVIPYIDLGGNVRHALVFIAKDHLDHVPLFDLFTDSVTHWIDGDLLDVPPGFKEWIAQNELSPN